MKKALITFVKAPVKGTVKTRLQKDLPAERTLRIYKTFVEETVSGCTGMRGVDRYLGCAPSDEHPYLQKMSREYRLPTFNQRGKTLGLKIVNAFQDYFQQGYSRIVLIGSDSPTIPGEFIQQAFRELQSKDFVLGPCCDGGIYLIGAKQQIEPKIFHRIPWDTADVLKKVLAKVYRYNIHFSLLPFWYDVDTIDDLHFLKLHLKYLKKHMPL